MCHYTHLLFLSNLVEQVCLSPLTEDPLLIIIGREEADHTPGNHSAKVEQGSPQFINLAQAEK